MTRDDKPDGFRPVYCIQTEKKIKMKFVRMKTIPRLIDFLISELI